MITDDEIRNVANSNRNSAERDVILGLLDRIVQLERRVDALDDVRSKAAP